MNRDEAWALLCAWTETESLRRHARAVEIAMRAAAERYGPGPEAVELWGMAGMLHDADYEKWPEEHPARIVQWLEERGEPEMAYAISAHYTQWGREYRTALDKALLACDELTGFIMACSYLRPEGITTLEPKSVRKKLKDKAFAAGVDRFEVSEGARLLGVEIDEHVAFLIGALRPYAEELGLLGKNAATAS
ncbi:MAG: metal-dependent phosphohydrolase [Planctomycetota bacterium]|nr:metal-dependent phosphohydrolase [Planctomycetota bacterium]